jgi:hypothetical protein
LQGCAAPRASSAFAQECEGGRQRIEDYQPSAAVTPNSALRSALAACRAPSMSPGLSRVLCASGEAARDRQIVLAARLVADDVEQV